MKVKECIVALPRDSEYKDGRDVLIGIVVKMYVVLPYTNYVLFCVFYVKGALFFFFLKELILILPVVLEDRTLPCFADETVEGQRVAFTCPKSLRKWQSKNCEAKPVAFVCVCAINHCDNEDHLSSTASSFCH